MQIFRPLVVLLLILITQSVTAQTRLKEFLSLHNQERESLELPALEWSDELQKSAQLIANTMAFKDKYEPGNSGRGENSWSGENNGATFEEIFEIWRSGKSNFQAENPVPLNCSQQFERCAGYSQIVWQQTTHIGCAAAASMENDYIVCHYDPAGNIQDQKAY